MKAFAIGKFALLRLLMACAWMPSLITGVYAATCEPHQLESYRRRYASAEQCWAREQTQRGSSRECCERAHALGRPATSTEPPRQNQQPSARHRADPSEPSSDPVSVTEGRATNLIMGVCYSSVAIQNMFASVCSNFGPAGQLAGTSIWEQVAAACRIAQRNCRSNYTETLSRLSTNLNCKGATQDRHFCE